jgi:hypothetical protein
MRQSAYNRYVDLTILKLIQWLDMFVELGVPTVDSCHLETHTEYFN